MNRQTGFSGCLLLVCLVTNGAFADDDAPTPDRFSARDVFDLEFASDPQISPDGSQVVYVRNFMDVMTDRPRSNLWIVNTDGSEHRPLTTGIHNDSSPRWSPDGTRVAYVSNVDGESQLYCRWLDSGQIARLTNLTSSPAGLSWSPDGRWLSFSMHVPTSEPPFAEMPGKPEGAEWAAPAKTIDRLIYRFDGKGYLEDGYRQLFVVPADGGTPRQLTQGNFNHDGRPVWTPDSRSLLFSSNRDADWEYQPEDSEIYEVVVETGEITALTDRDGPDHSPAVSPDGTQIAWLGYDDHRQGYQVTRLSVMNRDGSGKRLLTGDFDRSVESPLWNADGTSLYFQYDDLGTTKIGRVTLAGVVSTLVSDVGGVTIGRPYASGSYSVASTGAIAYTRARPDRPADVAVAAGEAVLLTQLNEDLLGHKRLSEVSEFSVRSSVDDREIQGWVLRPPDFDPACKYPLILEIHGGPFANYGPRFSAEMQLYAAAGYVVLYVNPRGSTSYGEEFGNLIHHAYPGDDFHDLMSAVDAMTGNEFIDTENLFVTGGSGGGVLTAWIVGHTDRFRAAVSAKPVINWYSFVLTADAYNFFHEYWFPGYPWEQPEHYLARSPLAYVGNVTTPTMLITGEQDYRTPSSEAEQFYQALKLRRIDTMLVRIPGASHNIAARPSQMITKVAHVLAWFGRHRKVGDQ